MNPRKASAVAVTALLAALAFPVLAAASAQEQQPNDGDQTLRAMRDEMNRSKARLELQIDLGFDDRVVGLGAGIFFVGYVVLEIPGALLAELWSARKWIARIMISWGLLTMAMAFIRTKAEFYSVRFLVGAAEAGFFPAILVYISHWFQQRDRATATASFVAANPVSYIIGSPLAGLLLGITWFGLRGWRWLFILEGMPAIIFGTVALFYLTDWPREAKWLPSEERDWLVGELDREKDAKRKTGAVGVWQALCQRDVILLTLCYFFAMYGNYGLGFWLPTILKRISGQSNLRVTLLAALPYLAGLAMQWVNSWHSDRTGERKKHSALPLLVSAAMLAVAAAFSSQLAPALIFFIFAEAAYFAFQPPFWAVPTMFLGESAAAASMGLINSLGNLGGFAGPFLVGAISSSTHSFTGGLWSVVAGFALSGLLMLAVGAGKSGAGTARSFSGLGRSRLESRDP